MIRPSLRKGLPYGWWRGVRLPDWLLIPVSLLILSASGAALFVEWFGLR